jgi:hypothetical protein
MQLDLKTTIYVASGYGCLLFFSLWMRDLNTRIFIQFILVFGLMHLFITFARSTRANPKEELKGSQNFRDSVEETTLPLKGAAGGRGANPGDKEP